MSDTLKTRSTLLTHRYCIDIIHIYLMFIWLRRHGSFLPPSSKTAKMATIITWPQILWRTRYVKRGSQTTSSVSSKSSRDHIHVHVQWETLPKNKGNLQSQQCTNYGVDIKVSALFYFKLLRSHSIFFPSFFSLKFFLFIY